MNFVSIVRALINGTLIVVGISTSFAQVPIVPKEFTFENPSSIVTLQTINRTVQTAQNVIPGFSPNIGLPMSQVSNPSLNALQKFRIPPPGSSSEVQRNYADEDIRQLELQKQENKRQIAEANKTFEETNIDYLLPFEPSPLKNSYGHAFSELSKMLSGNSPISIEKAVYLVESAFDPTISYKNFSNELNKAANIIGLKMQQDKISANDNVGKIMTAFRYMADTISVRTQTESTITTYPKKYDFEDFWGRGDYKKMFVSKLLKEGSGQCHSLPLLFLILCEKIGADANLSFAPNHSFIKFKDKRGKWHNLELTSNMLASDHLMIESGYIKAEALQNRIYLEPLSRKEVIAQCLNDLAIGYQKKFGYDPFVLECSNLALEYLPNSLTAKQNLANYNITLSNYIAYQYKVKRLPKVLFDQDEKAQDIIKRTNESIKQIELLGFADMPPEAYEAWLKSIKIEANKQRHEQEVKVLGTMIEIKK